MTGPDSPILSVRGLVHRYGRRLALDHVDLDLWRGEVLGIVGESGSGKSTLLACLAGRLMPTGGDILFRPRAGAPVAMVRDDPTERRRRLRGEIGFVHQNPRDGLRLSVSAGANVAEPLMVAGDRVYDALRETAAGWLDRVEIGRERIDDPPRQYSGGMQQRLQIARALVTGPAMVLMDEPTGGLDVSVQARLLDLLRGLVADIGIACVVVTHDLGVARLLAHRLLVMREGRVVEGGLTDRVLDDPRDAYTQLLVSSVLPA
jgi:putative phosphonate transport system ATP-binding protein